MSSNCIDYNAQRLIIWGSVEIKVVDIMCPQANVPPKLNTALKNNYRTPQPPPISISSHCTGPLEVEVTRATHHCRTPPPPPLLHAASPRRHQIAGQVGSGL